MPSAELIGLEAPKKAHRSLVFALAAPCRQIESAGGIAVTSAVSATVYRIGPINHPKAPQERHGDKSRFMSLLTEFAALADGLCFTVGRDSVEPRGSAERRPTNKKTRGEINCSPAQF